MVQKKILRYERTPYAKQIRKDYERGIVKERRCNMRQYSVRTDDCTNTISTVMKGHNTIIPAAIRGRYVGGVR